MWSGSIREGFRGYINNLGIVCTLLWWQLLPPPPLTQPMVGCGVFTHAGSKLEVRESAWYKKMRQTSHKESSGPVAIMLFIFGVRQSSINMLTK